MQLSLHRMIKYGLKGRPYLKIGQRISVTRDELKSSPVITQSYSTVFEYSAVGQNYGVYFANTLIMTSSNGNIFRVTGPLWQNVIVIA